MSGSEYDNEVYSEIDPPAEEEFTMDTNTCYRSAPKSTTEDPNAPKIMDSSMVKAYLVAFAVIMIALLLGTVGACIAFTIEIVKLKSQNATGGTGSPGPTAICWGRTDCPDTEGTELLYSGVAAGSL